MKLSLLCLIYLQPLTIFGQFNKCFVEVGFHGHAYNNTPVKVYVQSKEILSSYFDHSPITAMAGTNLFFIANSDSCYYVTTSSSSKHYFRPSLCLEGSEKVATNIFPLKVIVDNITLIQNIDLNKGIYIRVSYEYGVGKEGNVLRFVQSHEVFRDD